MPASLENQKTVSLITLKFNMTTFTISTSANFEFGLEPLLHTVPETAHLLGTCTRTVRNLIKTGFLEISYGFGKPRITRRSILNLAYNRETGTTKKSFKKIQLRNDKGRWATLFQSASG